MALDILIHEFSDEIANIDQSHFQLLFASIQYNSKENQSLLHVKLKFEKLGKAILDQIKPFLPLYHSQWKFIRFLARSEISELLSAKGRGRGGGVGTGLGRKPMDSCFESRERF